MKRDCCSNLDIKKVTDNKTFWKKTKPFLSDEKVSNEIAPYEKDTAHVLNTFFSNIVTNLKIHKYADPIANNISDLF